MLDRAGIGVAALAEPELLDQVVRNKSLMFADASASYASAALPTLRLSPSDAIRDALARDYAAWRTCSWRTRQHLRNCWQVSLRSRDA